MSVNSKPIKDQPEQKQRKLLKQILWFICLYVAALVMVGGFIYLMRFLLSFFQ